MKIVYFSPIPFDYLKQRPQHIAELLSHNNEVYYIEPTISLFHSVVKGGKTFTSKRYDVTNKLHIIKANGLFSFPRCMEVYDVFSFNTFSERQQLKKFLQQCDLIWIGNPTWFNVIKHASNKQIVYDKMDNFKELTTNPFLKKLIDKTENALIESANIILTSCEVFYREVEKKNPNTFLIRNGVSIDFVKNIKLNIEVNEVNRKKIFGYIGAISHWYDFHVLEVILDQNEKNEIVLIGDNLMPEMKHSRVHYIEKIPKSKIPEAIMHFDVCLYNFKQTPLLDTINPVKIYEYLAMNKPVLAVESVETKQYENELMLYKCDEDILFYLSNEIKKPFNDDISIEKFIYENSWEMRVQRIEQILSGLGKEADSNEKSNACIWDTP